MRHRRNPRGFFAAEILFGLLVVAALITSLIVVVTKQHKAEEHLAARRAQDRALESAVLTLQAGAPSPQGITLTPLSSPAPQGYAWVRVSLSGTPATAPSLIALVPQSTSPQPGGPQ